MSVDELFAAVRADPTHYGALMQLGTALAERDNAPAARTVFEQAVRAHPGAVAPRACLGTLLADAGEHAAALLQFDAALALDASCREAHRGIAVIAEREGRSHDAQRAWRRGFPNGSIERSQYRGDGTPLRVLYVTSALGGNIPMHHVLDERLVDVVTLIAESAPDDITLPPHDVLFNAVGDADRCARALAHVARIAERSRAPVVNAPAAVLRTGRVANAERLRALPGVRTPRMAAFGADAVRAPDGAHRIAAHGFTWPLLVRSPGFQTGEHFERVEGPEALAGCVASLPGSTLLAVEFVDGRGADGAYRKYRVMAIGGRLYPVHLAIADGWKVHYFRAGMHDRADRRDEEAAFLRDMRAALSERAVTALEQIAADLALDYGGIDFTLLPGGDVLVFEANATMVLAPPDADPRWDYRRAAIATAIDAARELVALRAAVIPRSTPAARGAPSSETPPSS